MCICTSLYIHLNPTNELAVGDAGQLYDSVHREIFSLDPDTKIFPGTPPCLGFTFTGLGFTVYGVGFRV